MWKLLVVFVVLSAIASDVLCAPTTVKPAKKKHRETFIEVAYGEEKIVLGNFVNASQMKDKPVVDWKMEDGSLYALLMINLQAPSKMNPVDSDYVHWLVVNIPKNDIEKGDTLVDYVGAFPAKDVGSQSFMFILYQQPEKDRMNFTEKFISKTNGADRKNFDVTKFVLKYNLPYALSFNTLKAEYDEYSDVLKQQLYPEETGKDEVKIEATNDKEADDGKINLTKNHKFTCNEGEPGEDEPKAVKPQLKMDSDDKMENKRKEDENLGEKLVETKEAIATEPVTTPTGSSTTKSAAKETD